MIPRHYLDAEWLVGASKSIFSLFCLPNMDETLFQYKRDKPFKNYSKVDAVSKNGGENVFLGKNYTRWQNWTINALWRKELEKFLELNTFFLEFILMLQLVHFRPISFLTSFYFTRMNCKFTRENCNYESLSINTYFRSDFSSSFSFYLQKKFAAMQSRAPSSSQD